MHDQTAVSLLTRAWQNECDGWLALGQTKGSAYRVERSGSVTYAWWEGEPGAIDNYVMIEHDYTGDLREAVAPFAARIAGSQSPTVIRFVDAGSGQRWAAQAEELGFGRGYAAPVMACPLDSGWRGFSPAPEVTVARADDDQSYREAFEVVHAVYGGAHSITRFFNPNGPVRLYTGYWEGTPASSATLWPFSGAAGIYSVATLPEYRHRGLALATMQRLLDDAAADGFDLAILRTADELFPLYGRLGFGFVGRVQNFTSGRQAAG